MQGLALSTAKEITDGFALKNIDNSRVGEDFYNYLNDYIYRTKPRPCVLMCGGEVKDVYVYPYRDLNGEIMEFDLLYQAEDAYFTAKAGAKQFRDLYTRLNSVVNAGLKKSKKRLTAVLSRVKDAETAEENRIKGELILANIYKLKTGEKQAELDNYYDGTKIAVALDERLSPSKNAETYYKKYNKQKRALTSLIPQKESAESEMRYLESVGCELSLCQNFADLKAVEEELILSGLIKSVVKRGKRAEETAKSKIYDVYGFTVKCGRNNAENDKITFSAKPWDIWLHAKDYHSSHVIIETNGKKPPERVITAAAEICAYYSKGRDGGKTEIVYCERKFVKKPKKSPLGFCTYTDFKSLMAEPNEHKELLKN